MILDEKCILAPPPPYLQAIAGSSNPPRRRSNLTFSSLPSHLLLQIVYCTFPLEDGEYDGDSKVVRQRENLHWLETSLRLVNRALYIACMHILRSTYLPAYDRLVRPPYSSDPFPTSSPSEIQSSTSPLFTHHRELATLDRFISLLAHEDRLLDTSDLHLPREEAYKDLFDLVQPKSRLEDLIAEQGSRLGVVVLDRLRSKGHRSTNNGLSFSSAMTSTSTLNSPHDSTCSIKKHYDTETSSSSSSPVPSVPSLSIAKRKKSSFNLFSFGRSKKPVAPPPSPSVPVQRPSIDPIPFSTLSISFSPRSIGLVYTPPPEALRSPSATCSSSPYGGSTYGSLSMSMNANVLRKKTLVVINRTRDEPLEVSAKRLVQSLQTWLEED
ncbi:hypothetical protein EDD85DRAFT_950400 [Armillaria nabsnona]|nr:hypothetical protein EDD85DRAFT_950400 [Armillaria nabsnona]